MTRREFDRLVSMAYEVGSNAAWAQYEEQRYEDLAAEADRVARYGYDDGEYVPGCSQDDTVDHKGRPLRSRYNEAGEPRW